MVYACCGAKHASTRHSRHASDLCFLCFLHTYICIQVNSTILVEDHVPHDIAALHAPGVAEVCLQEPRKVILHELQDSCLVPEHLLPPRVVHLRSTDIDSQ
jgi:hypothetical protein